MRPCEGYQLTDRLSKNLEDERTSPHIGAVLHFGSDLCRFWQCRDCSSVSPLTTLSSTTLFSREHAPLPLSRPADHRFCGGAADLQPDWSKDLPAWPSAAQRRRVFVSAHLYMWGCFHRSLRLRGIPTGYLAWILRHGPFSSDGTIRGRAAAGA